MNNENAMSPERGKELRGRHPLYSRLSGEVVWGLYEELDYSAEDCGKAMDVFLEQMREVLRVMDALEAVPEGCFVLEFSNSECAFRQGIPECAIPVARADWRKFLPPFAVGCKAKARIPDDAERKLTNADAVLSDNASPPSCALMCPLLAAPW